MNEETLKNFFKVTKSYIIIPRGGLNPSGTITTDGRTCIRDPILGKYQVENSLLILNMKMRRM